MSNHIESLQEIIEMLTRIENALHRRPCQNAETKRCLDTKNPRLNQMCDECAGYWLLRRAGHRLREARCLEKEKQ